MRRSNNIAAIASSVGRRKNGGKIAQSEIDRNIYEGELLYGERCAECGVSLNQYATGQMEYCKKCKTIVDSRPKKEGFWKRLFKKL